MAPAHRERAGKEGGSWVKKTVAEKGGSEEDAEAKTSDATGRERRSRQQRDNRTGKGAARDRDGPVGAGPLQAPATGAEETDGRGPKSGKGSRGNKGNRKGGGGGGGADARADADEDDLSGIALLSLLKANPPKVTKYTKGELLSIARLPLSNIRPEDLSPLIDKDNKESLLLVGQTSTGRSSSQGPEGTVPETARKERRERRAERKSAAKDENDDEADETNRKAAPVSNDAPRSGGDLAVGTSAPSTFTPKAGGIGADKSARLGAELDTEAAKRALMDKWLQDKALQQNATGIASPAATQAALAQAAAASSAAAARAGAAGNAQGYQQSLLHQQAVLSQAAQAQALQVQAASYLQAMAFSAAQQNSRAAAAAGYADWGYNPYAAGLLGYSNPYGNPAGASHYPGLDYSVPPQAPGKGQERSLEAIQGKLAAAAAQSHAATRASHSQQSMALAAAAAAAASAQGCPNPNSAAAKKGSPEKAVAKAESKPVDNPEARDMEQSRAANEGGDGEDDAGCSQS
mmetsp:Transcript_42509/g.97397  ORF Transcript_42509/g.97397 Transcript_42509/m.97397 type:complete len:519 (+) Transcript_42509:107-1663(+)